MGAKEAKERTEALIKLALSSGKLNWSKLLQKTKVSRRTLARRLKEMISDGRIERTVDSSTYPPSVFYTITAKGKKDVKPFMMEFEKVQENFKLREILARLCVAKFLKTVEENGEFKEVNRLYHEALDSMNYLVAVTYTDAKSVKNDVLRNEIIRRAVEAEAQLSEMVAEALYEHPELIPEQFLLLMSKEPISINLLEWARGKGYITEQELDYTKKTFPVK